MMDRFIVAPEIATKLPNMQVVVFTAYNLTNTGVNSKVTKFAEETAKTTLSTLSSYPNAQSHPRIGLYRDTLKAAYNLSPKKFPQSNESLYKRLMKAQAPLRPINPIVDFYNSVSIKYGVTAGAFDLGELQTRSIKPLELRLSRQGDTFKALDADEGSGAVSTGEGEVVYVQDGTVLTRHLAWRQAREGLVREETRNVIFVSEVLGDGKSGETPELARQVAGELVDGIKEFFGVEGKVSILGKGVGKLEVEVESSFF